MRQLRIFIGVLVTGLAVSAGADLQFSSGSFFGGSQLLDPDDSSPLAAGSLVLLVQDGNTDGFADIDPFTGEPDGLNDSVVLRSSIGQGGFGPGFDTGAISLSLVAAQLPAPVAQLYLIVFDAPDGSVTAGTNFGTSFGVGGVDSSTAQTGIPSGTYLYQNTNPGQSWQVGASGEGFALNQQVQLIPEPGTFVLTLSGFAALFLLRRKRATT